MYAVGDEAARMYPLPDGHGVHAGVYLPFSLSTVCLVVRHFHC